MAETIKSTDLISQRIREIIGKLGGLKKTSEATGISVTQLSDYQTAKDKPGSIMLEKLARAAEVSVDWILGLKVGEAPDPYGDLDRSDHKLLKEIEELLRDADDDVKRHLRDEVKLLRRVQRSPKKRVSGED